MCDVTLRATQQWLAHTSMYTVMGGRAGSGCRLNQATRMPSGRRNNKAMTYRNSTPLTQATGVTLYRG